MVKMAVSSLVLLALSASAWGQPGSGDATAGQQKAAACVACHGQDGNSPDPQWPKIAGQNIRYTAKQLHDFKSGARENAIMKGMASGLSDQDMQDLAAYFSQQKVTYGTANPDLVELGQALYRGGDKERGIPSCMGCHGPRGKGNPAAGWPALAGQYADYVSSQLKAFRSHQRANDPNGMMRDTASRLSDEDIAALATYIQGLR